MAGFNFEDFKRALKKKEEENFLKLKEEIRRLQFNIEKFFTFFFESTANQTQTKYSNLGIY